MSRFFNPAFLVTDEIAAFLEHNAIHQASFFDLAETRNPWEVTIDLFRQIQGRVDSLETEIRTSYPFTEIAAVITSNRLFWVLEETLREYFDSMRDPIARLKSDGPMPTWKMTSAELAGGHMENLRHLVLSAAHDMVMLMHLREALGRNHSLMHREFETNERSVYLLLEYIKKYGPNIALAMQENFVLMERCLVTFEAVRRGHVEKEQLGYSINDLTKVRKILDNRCRRELPPFVQNYEAIHHQMTNAMREGESTYLSRLCRWELTFALMEEIPEGYHTQSELILFERDRMKHIVAYREQELGSSPTGQNALAYNERAERKREEKQTGATAIPAPKAAVQEEPVQEEDFGDSPTKAKAFKHRMAFSSRRG